MSDRCPDCGTRQRPNPLPWLLLPIVLGGAAAGFVLLFGERFGLGATALIITLPFVAFLFALKQATAAWAAVDLTRCRKCGKDLVTTGSGEAS